MHSTPASQHVAETLKSVPPHLANMGMQVSSSQSFSACMTSTILCVVCHTLSCCGCGTALEAHLSKAPHSHVHSIILLPCPEIRSFGCIVWHIFTCIKHSAIPTSIQYIYCCACRCQALSIIPTQHWMSELNTPSMATSQPA